MSAMRSLLLALLVITVLISITAPDTCARSIKAYFNGQEATVENVSLPVGEIFTVDLYMQPDGDSFAYATLTEPGYTLAYDRVAGDVIGDTVTRQCTESQPACFNWTLTANENWVGGTAPVNIYCQLNHKSETQPYVRAYFTVVEAEILPRVQDPDQGVAESVSAMQELLIVLIGIAIAVSIFRKNEE